MLRILGLRAFLVLSRLDPAHWSNLGTVTSRFKANLRKTKTKPTRKLHRNPCDLVLGMRAEGRHPVGWLNCGPTSRQLWALVLGPLWEQSSTRRPKGAAEKTGSSSRHSPVPFDALGCKHQSCTEGSVSTLWVVGYLTGVVLSVSDDTDRCVCSWLAK